jgi:hypothetical protein
LYNQTSDFIPNTSLSGFHDSGTTQTQSFYELPSNAAYSPTDVFPSESSISETMDEQKFIEYPIARLKRNELVENGKFLCNNADCQLIFDENRARNNHLRDHEKPVHCSWPGCQFKNSWRRDVIRHYDTHCSQKTIPCPQCIETFTRPDNLKRHIEETHVGNKRSRVS